MFSSNLSHDEGAERECELSIPPHSKFIYICIVLIRLTNLEHIYMQIIISLLEIPLPDLEHNYAYHCLKYIRLPDLEHMQHIVIIAHYNHCLKYANISGN